MGLPQDTTADELRANHAVSDSVAAAGHSEMHARTVLRVRPEERQRIRGFRERAGPRKSFLELQVRQSLRV